LLDRNYSHHRMALQVFVRGRTETDLHQLDLIQVYTLMR
jgi:hypothetical protein